LLGRNGSGKTTLLHLISMVLRDDFKSVRSEEFALEYELVGDTNSFVITVTNTPVSSPQPAERRYSSAMYVVWSEPAKPEHNRHVTEAVSTVVDGRGGIIRTEALFRARYLAIYDVLQRPEGGMSLDSADAAWLASHWEENCYRLDEGLSSFDSITGANEHHGPSLPPPSSTGFYSTAQGVVQVKSFGGFVPDSLWSEMATRLDINRPIVEFDLDGDVQLNKFVSLLGARRVAVVAKRMDSAVQHEGGSRHFRNFDFYAETSPSRLIPHQHWSFGQQRLLTLFWYLACNPEVLVVDEPVNGLHWEWIEAFVEAIGDRQVFVTAQNPLLLEHVGFDSPEKVQRSFVLCRRETKGEDEREMVWAQPTPEQAESFFRAWSTGVQPVHEVLKTEGLW
ncbi:MAG: ATP-binding protein, partial [Myxococcaceae bacterium]